MCSDQGTPPQNTESFGWHMEPTSWSHDGTKSFVFLHLILFQGISVVVVHQNLQLCVEVRMLHRDLRSSEHVLTLTRSEPSPLLRYYCQQHAS